MFFFSEINGDKKRLEVYCKNEIQHCDESGATRGGAGEQAGSVGKGTEPFSHAYGWSAAALGFRIPMPDCSAYALD